MKRKRNLLLRFDRALAHDLRQQVLILFIILCVAFLLSYILLEWSGCQWEFFCEDSNINKLLLPLYLLIDTSTLNNLYMHGEHGWALFAATIVYLIGVVIFSGMIISVMINAFERRVQNHHNGTIYYLKSGHYIVMGYDEMVPSIIADILDNNKDVDVLLQTSENVVGIKEELQKFFDKKQRKQIIVNYGHRTSLEDYKNIHVESAKEIYIVGNRQHPAHDAINVECVDSICKYLIDYEDKKLPKRITCVFEDLDTYAAFKTSEIFQKVKALNMEFVPYNFYVGWAKQVFVKQCYRDKDGPNAVVKYPVVYGNGITPEDDKYVHLVFVGTTTFAASFAMEAANVLHFPNYVTKGKRTLITFIDKNADIAKNEFVTRNRHLFDVQRGWYEDLIDGEESSGKREVILPSKEYENDVDFLDVEFEFLKGDVFSASVQERIREWARDTNGQYLSLFLTQLTQRDNFVLGMNMPDEVYDNEIPVFIRQDRSDNFVTNLRNADIRNVNDKFVYSLVEKGELHSKYRDGRYAHLYPFGMNETAYCADENSILRAKLINYLYCTADYQTYKFQAIESLDSLPTEKIWSDAEKYWRELTVALKWPNLYNAYSIQVKLASLRAMRNLKIDDLSHDKSALSEQEAEMMARVEHNRWNVEKLLMGYRKARKEEDKYKYEEYADKLNSNKKLFIHHDICPYNDLNEIKALDKEFSCYIPWIIRMTEDKSVL